MTAIPTADGGEVRTRLSAADLYREAEWVRGLWRGEDDDHIGLFRGAVVENDGPGAGRSDEPGIEPFLEVEGSTWLRKVLHLEDAAGVGAQIAYVAREGGRRLRLDLETETPDFECFEARIDGGRWREVEARWEWPLHEGVNTAEMRTRNRSGLAGVTSSLSVIP